MSTTIDQRVVEMRFDNKHFEQNVSQTMSTLEKFKQKLHLTGATKGLEDVNSAVKNVNMTGLGSAVDMVCTRFSALQVMGVTALANITNSAVNAGKRMVSALTIDPIKTGFQEYETQINAVQTILANTQSKGTTIDQVNEALEELNAYADKTIYNFTEMTRNIGTFTAAGVDLDTSVSAIQGIANLAAVSGSTSQQASTAMYQLSQALASGTVKLQDWNSVVNAGMGGEAFQNALVRTAAALDGSADSLDAWRKQNIDSWGSFRDSLTKGEWLTAEVLTETLNQFTMAAEEGSDQWEKYKKSLLDKGYTEAQANEILKMANTATDAATKVKTFTQLWDVLQESVQSGWSQTWKLIVGDFEEAKNLLTPLADFLTGMINGFSDARNRLLEGALDFASPWSNIVKKLEGAGFGGLSKLSEKIKNATYDLEYFQDIVTKVWRGDYRNLDTGRYELLDAAGYDHRVVQDLVNKGLYYKLTIEDVEASHAKFGLTMEKTASETKDVTVALENLTDEQLRNAGLTEDEIKLYRDLAAEAKRTGKSIGELADEMSKTDGRTLLINSFKNAGKGLIAVLAAVKDAWVEIFPPMSIVQLYNIIKAINSFSERLVVSEETAGYLKRTFKGLFAMLDIVMTLVGGPLKMAFDAVIKLLEKFDINILEYTASMGDAIVKLRDWIDENNIFVKGFEVIAPIVKDAVKAIRDWINSLKNADDLPKAIAEGIIKGFASIPKALISLVKIIRSKVSEKFGTIPDDMFSGFANGVRNGMIVALQVMVELGKAIIEKIESVLGIASPSTVFFAIGGFIIAGLIGGLLAGSDGVEETVKQIGTKIADFFGNFDLGSVVSTALNAGMLAVLWKIGDVASAIASPLEGLEDVFEGVGRVLRSTSKVVRKFASVLGAMSMSIRAQALKDIAIALLLLVGAVAVLTLLDTKKMWIAIGAIAALAAVLGILFAAMNALGKASSPKDVLQGVVNVAKISTVLVAMGASLLMIAAALKILESIDPENAETAFVGLTAIILAIAGVLVAYGLCVKGTSAKNINKLGSLLFTMSVSLLLMAAVVKILGSMDLATLIQGTLAVVAFGGIIAGLTAISKLAGNKIGGVGGAILKISAALMLMAVAIKIVGSIDLATLTKGTLAVVAFGGIIAGLTAIIKLMNPNDVNKLGSTLLSMSGAMLLMAIVAKILGGMDIGSLVKGTLAVAAFGGVMVGLVASTKLVSERDLKRVGTTLLMMSISIGILAMVSSLLSVINVASLVKGIFAVGLLGGIMSAMILATKYANDCRDNLIVMTLAIVAMAIAVGALSNIEFSKLASATAAMTLLMGAFSVVIKASSWASKSMGSLVIMTLAIGLIGGILYLLSGLPVESTIGSAIALSTLLMAISAALFILSKSSSNTVGALAAVISLAAMAIPLLAFVGIFALMSNLENARENAISLTILVGALTAALSVLTILGKFAYPALIGVGVLLLMAVPLVAFVGILALMEKLKDAEANVNLLIKLTTTLTKLLVILAVIGPFALIGVTAMTALVSLMGAVGILAIAVGSLMEKFPQLEEFLDKGIPILEKIAYAIGSFAGNLIGGFTDSISSSLPGLGTALSEFMTNATPFITGVKMVDDGMLKKMGILAASIIAITAADLIACIASFIQGGSSFATLGSELSLFMINASPFLAGVSTLNENVVTGVKALTSMILALTAANVIESLTSWFTGGSSITEFGNQLIPFGNAMVGFSSIVSGNIDEGAVTAAANAGKVMAEMAATLPNSGGVAGFFAGENDLSMFSSQLEPFAKAMVNFSSIVSGNIDEGAVTAAANAGNTLIAMADTIPNSGGVVGFFAGENDLDTFSDQIVAFGSAITKFSQTVSGNIDEGAVTAAANAGTMMADLANSIPNTGGVVSWFTGDNDMKTFGEQVVSFGEAMVDFSKTVSGNIDPEAVTAAADAGSTLSALANSLPESGGFVSIFTADNDMSTFAEELVNFGKKMVKFSEEIDGADFSKMSSVTNQFKSIVAAAKTIAGADVKGLGSLGDALGKFGKNSVQKFIDAFDGAETKVSDAAKTLVNAAANAMDDSGDKFTKSGKKVMENFSKAITESKKTATKAISSVLSGLTDTIKNKYSSFYSAGSYLVDGFAAGISENDYKAEAKARAMAKAAIEAAKDELDQNSPSRVFYDIGSGTGEGFVNALGDYASKVYRASSDMASNARTGFSNAIGKIADLIEADIDTQPTIRPVLDLSDVSKGAGAINGMFSLSPSVGVLAEVGAINSAMNSRQNVTNDDVISAIDRLGRGLNNVGNTSYNINGITYDDGSNVSEAVKTLIRAAKIERRV